MLLIASVKKKKKEVKFHDFEDKSEIFKNLFQF